MKILPEPYLWKRKDWSNVTHIWIWVQEFVEKFFNTMRYGNSADISAKTDQISTTILSYMYFCTEKDRLNSESQWCPDLDYGSRLNLSQWRSSLS